LNSYLYLGAYDKFLQSLPANDSAFISFYRGFGEYHRNNREQAKKDFDRAFELAPSLLQAEIGKALSYAVGDDRRTGLQVLRKTESEIEARGVSDSEAIYKVAQAYAVLGDKVSALRTLRRSIEGGFFCYPYFVGDPLLTTLRGGPEFEALTNEAKRRHEQFKARFFESSGQV
jgi:tetratricopeptide (TPR) repeat protein